MKYTIFVYALRHSGDLLPADHNVIATADFGGNAHGGKRAADRQRKLRNAHTCYITKVGDKRIVQVAKVMVHCASAGGSAHNSDAILFHEG